MRGSMAKVFISYTGHGDPDGKLAAFFADFLHARDHAVFIQTKIAPGEQWPAAVDTALQQADHFILILSSEAARSDMVIEEVRRAVRLRQSNGRPVIADPPWHGGDAVRSRCQAQPHSASEMVAPRR